MREAAYLGGVSAADADKAAAFALGENNKNSVTSTSNPPQKYLEFCKLSADGVIASGQTVPTAEASETLASNYDEDGNYLGSTVSSENASGVTSVTGFDEFGTTTGAITTQPNGDGTFRVTTEIDGNQIGFNATQDANGDLVANGVTHINGQPPVNDSLIDAAIDDLELTADDLVQGNTSGTLTHIIEAGDATNPNGTLPALTEVTGRLDWWNDERISGAAGIASDVVSLISALRAGKPLPIASAAFNFASHRLGDPAVANIAAALSGVISLQGLVDALEKGDLGRILIDGGGVARSGLTIYANSLRTQLAQGVVPGPGMLSTVEIEALNLELGSVKELLEGLGQAIAVLNIINSLAKGDIKGAVISAITLVNPVIGSILAAVDFFAGLIFAREPQFEADGRFVVSATGAISAEIGNVNGGAGNTWQAYMQQMLEQTKKQATAFGEASGQPMGIIASRLPQIEFKRDALFMKWNDPLTGATYYKTFDLQGNYLAPGRVQRILLGTSGQLLTSPYGPNPQNPESYNAQDPQDKVPGNQIANADNFFDSFAQHWSDAVTASGAIAPLWEVQTAYLQYNDGTNQARYVGWTTEQIAYNANSYGTPRPITHDGAISHPGDASPGNSRGTTATSQQNFTVIALDIDGDGQITTTKKATGNGVLFDVDNDGFAEETDWIGPRDGILVLDRTSSGAGRTTGQVADGQINRGADLFNDTWVDGSQRNLGVLNEINTRLSGDDFYGGITKDDPVFNALRVWFDINGDGVAQDAELQTLTQLGITKLDWNPYSNDTLGSFTHKGQNKRMEVVNLQANAAGVATVQVGGSLLIQKEVGDVSIGVSASSVGGGQTLLTQDPGLQLYATSVIDYSDSTDAAVRAAHTHTSATNLGGGTLTAVDEVLDAQEDLSITISIDQLLANDKSTGGAVRFVGLTAETNGTAIYTNYTANTIVFTPTANFNGQASFSYTVADAQGNQASATATVDVGAVDDAPVVTLAPNRRQAGWKDLGLTANAQGQQVYILPGYSGVATTSPEVAAAVKVVGYYGDSGTALLPDSTGVVGFVGGKLYFAAFAQPGQISSQGPWQEVLINAVDDGAVTGTLTVTDVDATGRLNINADLTNVRTGQFGHAVVVDQGNGTATYSYTRNSLPSQEASTFMQGVTEASEGTAVYVAPQIGPDDAFYVRIREDVPVAAQLAGEEIVNFQKVIIKAPDFTAAGSEADYLRLTDGSLRPQPDNNPPWAPGDAGAPIVLDLNDNGFRFIGAQDSTAFYDLTGDGVRRATAWTSGQDALLAFDANGDGKISGKAELSFKDYKPGAQTDLQGLAAFDTNNDGIFSAADAQWAAFRVWQDKNEDGVQTPDELSTLAQRGIQSIALVSNNQSTSNQGVTVHGVGSYTRIDGSQAQLADVAFANTGETAGSVKDDTVDLTATPAAIVNTGGGDDTVTGSGAAEQINTGTGNDTVKAGMGQYWGSGMRRCRGRPTATHFSLRRQRKVSKRKATRSLGPFASLRATCGAQTQWGHVQTRLRLKQARALIHWVLRSSAQPGRGFYLARTVVFTLNANFTGQASFIKSQEPWQEVLVNAVDVRATTTVTMKKIAASAVFTRVGGRFGLKAVNDEIFKCAA